MSEVKIRVLAAKSTYRTEVFVDGIMAYSTSMHPEIEIANLKSLIIALGISNTVVLGEGEN